ncbi:MAG: hypothetical protein ABS949_19825 [Solibacillus sp.]
MPGKKIAYQTRKKVRIWFVRHIPQEQTEEARKSNENKRLKANFSEERAELTKTTTARLNALQDALNASTEDVKALSGEISNLTAESEKEKEKFEAEKTMIEERKALGNERALVALEREYQAKLQEQINTYKGSRQIYGFTTLSKEHSQTTLWECFS